MPGKITAQARCAADSPVAKSTAMTAKKAGVPARTRTAETKAGSKVATTLTKTSSRKDHTSALVSPSTDELVDATKSPARCSTSISNALARLLGHPLSLQKAPAQQGESRRQEKPTEHLSEYKKIRLAKLVVNGVLGSLNELIKDGWHVDDFLKGNALSRPSSVSSSSRSSPAPSSRSLQTGSSSRTSSRAPTSQTLATSSKEQATSKGGQVTLANAHALFDCYRTATRFLLEVKESSSVQTEATKQAGTEIESVMISIVSKLVAIGLLANADAELCYLNKALSSKCHENDGEEQTEAYLFAIPRANTPISPALLGLILSTQSLSLSCKLSSATEATLRHHARQAHDHANGPMSWQRYARSIIGDKDAISSADQAAYSIERSIGRCLARLHDASSEVASTSKKSSLHEVALEVRKVSLDFLMLVSDLDVDAFWDRCSRVGVSYFRSKLSGEASDAKRKANAFSVVDAVFRDLIQLFAQLQGTQKTKLTNGLRKLFDTWMDLAKRAAVSTAIDQIAVLSSSMLSTTSEEKVTTHGKSVQSTDEAVIFQSYADVTAALAKGVIGLEEVTYGETTLAALKHVLSITVGAVEASSWGRDVSLDTKIFRSIDQLRRRALKILDMETAKSEGSGGSQAALLKVSGALRPLLVAIVSSLEAHVRSHSARLPNSKRASDEAEESQRPDVVLANIVQTIRILSHATLVVSDCVSIDTSEQDLTRCRALINETGKDGRTLFDYGTRAQNLYLVSSSMWHFGGKLHNATRYSDAVRFLQPCCVLADDAVELLNASRGAGERSGWSSEKAQEGQPKRWLHLAASYNMTLQPHKALHAYSKAIARLGEALWPTIATASSSKAICDIFDRSDELSTTLSQLALQLVDAFSTPDLQTKSDDDDTEDGHPMLPWLDVLKQIDRAALGACLEYCVLSLDKSLHYPGAARAAFSLLSAAKSKYASNENPLRRARVLLRRLELEILLGEEGSRQEAQEALEQVIDEIRALLLVTDLHADVGLARYRLQYQATLDLLLTLRGQHLRSTTAQKSVIRSAKDASSALRRISAEANKVTQEKSVVKKKIGAKAEPLKVTRAPRQVKTKARPASPVTPPSKKLTLGATRSVPQSPALVADAARFDDIERLCSLVELVYEAVNAFGHTLASIELLKVLRRLDLMGRGIKGRDGYLRASADLARQYLLLGKLSRAEAIINPVVYHDLKRKDWGISDHTRARCLLSHADVLCHAGLVEESMATYDEAVELASQIQPSTSKNDVHTFIEKCQGYERRALAYDICASIHYARGNLTASITAAIESVRYASKTSNSLAKLTGPVDSSTEDGSPFDQQVAAEEGQGESDVSKALSLPKLSSWSIATAHWRTVKMLLHAYLRVSRLNMCRGTARDAEMYASEGIGLSASLNIPLSACHALIERGGIRIKMGETESGEADLDQVAALLENDWIPEAAAMACIRGDRMSRAEVLAEALRFYKQGQEILKSLSGTFSDLDSLLPSPPRRRVDGGEAAPSIPQIGQESLLPRVKARLLRRQAWLLELMGRNQESREVLEEAALVEATAATQSVKLEHALVAGRIAMRNSMQKLRAEQVLGMIAESCLSLPMMARGGAKASGTSLALSGSGTAAKAALKSLSLANAAFVEALSAQGGRCGDSTEVRDTLVHLAAARLLHASLDRRATDHHLIVTHLCDLINSGASVTLQRELLDAVESKLRPREAESREWFQFHGLVPSKSKDICAQPLSSDSDSTSSSSSKGNKSKSDRHSYWEDVSKRHQQLELDEKIVFERASLPPNWTVVSITVSPNRDQLLLSRRGGSQVPLVISLPIDRQSRREGEEEALTIDAALEELHDIVEESNHATHAAKDLEGFEARRSWWSLRRELDARLKVLLEGIETTWLGAFKSVFLPSVNASAEELDTLRDSLNKILGQPLAAGSSPSAAKRVKIDDAIVECFARLAPAETTDEDYEDMLHFIMDAYQLSGVPVAVDEMDLDQSVVDLRSALESMRSKRTQRMASKQRGKKDQDNEGSSNEEDHLFLVLDRDTCVIPWESMPSLRSRAVSRIPSLAFLEDRLVELQGKRGKTIDANGAKKYYLINPAGDLTRTQERFEPLLKGQTRHSQPWTGVAGRVPLLDEYANALSSNDVVVFFGHGGAEQYIRSHRLKSLQQCAVTMLWGCSSAMLRDQGDFDRCGTAYNYMLAGCPALVGNLWDATDRELDGISETVLDKVGLVSRPPQDGEETERGGAVAAAADDIKSQMSLTQAVAASRDACKLPYLSGAACVVYGIPVYFS